MASLRLLATLATISVGLAGLEWWSANILYGATHPAGPMTGVAFIAILAILPRLLNRFTGHWCDAIVAALTAVVELIFCVAILGSLSAIAAMLLPVSMTSRFMQGDAATDFIIFLMFSVGLLIAARGWKQYSNQALLASKAQLEMERARAQVAERDRELARSELTVLRAQIEPHFLWNTLAHVQYLTRKNPDEAEKMTGHLIKFLRSAVPQTRENKTTLGSELESIRAYLELMKIRMGARLRVTVTLAPALAEVPFPPLLIQTLVENAITHGLEPKVGPVSLSVNAAISADGRNLTIEVQDDGVGLMNGPATQGTGLGLNSVRDRLQLIFNGEADLIVSGSVGGGVVSKIQAPLPTPNLSS